ncbi:two component system sensor kinase, partial [Salmonella enterica subsp. enterica serovar Enteritidis]|nr:two component system sensor kinase [Salmonella enterica subsp. enterica serovar Enteritidis]
HASVAVADQQGVFFGVTVKLPDLITKRHLPLDDSIRVWLDQNNHLLPFSYIPQKIRTQLENVTLHDGWQVALSNEIGKFTRHPKKYAL